MRRKKSGRGREVLLEAMSTARNQIVTLVLLAASCAFAIAAAVVGVSDNPPGILLGFFAALALVSAVAHRWRTEKAFRGLFFSSFLFVVLAEIFEGLQRVSSVLAEVGFVAAVLLFPAALLIGLVGWIAIGIRNRRPQAQS